jgi:hypothetical protein
MSEITTRDGSQTIRVLREEIVKRDSKIELLQRALYRAWDDLNELRGDAQEAEKRAFDAIETLK